MEGKSGNYLSMISRTLLYCEAGRNKAVHCDGLSKEDFKKTVGVMEKIVDKINEIQQKKSEQELSIDSIPWANTRHK